MGDFQYDRLDSLLKKNGTTRKYLCLSAGHADNYIRGFEKRGKEPPREFVKYCADKLGTTTAYLYGETDDPSPVPAPAAPEQKEKPAPGEGSGLDEDVKSKAYTILDKLSKLPTKQQEAFLNSLDISIDAALNMMGGNGNG